MSKDLAASVRARLLNLAKAYKTDFNQVLVRYALECLLGSPRFQCNNPKSGSYPATVSQSDGSHGGSGRVILATT